MSGHTSHDIHHTMGKSVSCSVSCPICRGMYVLSCNKKTKWFLSHTTCTVRHVQIISISCDDSTSHDIHSTTYIVCTLKTKKLHLARHTSHDIHVLFQYIMSWLNSTRHTSHDMHWIHVRATCRVMCPAMLLSKACRAMYVVSLMHGTAYTARHH